VSESARRNQEAEERADELLHSWLSPDQRNQYDEHGYIEVVGSDTGKRYRIHHGRTVNIQELDAAGRHACRWCFGPRDWFPTGDFNLAQKIALETFESEALAIANRSEVAVPNRGPPPSPWSWLLRLLRSRLTRPAW
jgi:hypothetical protein